jgi:AcrR family transcriptional regulator
VRAAAGERDSDRREQMVRVQRTRLLGAMTAAVVDEGVAGVAVSDVLVRAGVSRRTFYEIFDGVEQCLLAALEQALAAARERALAAYDERAPWAARLRAALAELLAFFEQEPDCARLLLVDVLAAGPAVLARRGQVLSELAAVVDAGRDPGARGAGARKAGGTGARGAGGTGARGGRGAVVSPLAAEGAVGAVASILYERLRAGERSLLSLCGPLMGIVVLPYLGAAAARREAARPVPKAAAGAAAARGRRRAVAANPLDGLPMRLTYRTLRVLRAIDADPGASNRRIGHDAGIADQGQISKLLARLARLGLVYNAGAGSGARGAPNTWLLTARGADVVHATMAGPDAPRGRGG